MTHDDLLEKIIKLSHTDSTMALMSVIKLHKEYVSPNILDNKTVCMYCTDDKVVYYPCLTIRVIENEL